MKSNRTRPNWRFPVLLAIFLGLTLLGIGAQMLGTLGSSVERELGRTAKAAAQTLPFAVEKALQEDAERVAAPRGPVRREDPTDCPVSFRILQSELTAAPPPAGPALFRPRTDTVAEGDRTCAEFAAAFPYTDAGLRSHAEDIILRRCPTTRGTLGTPLGAAILVERQDEAGLKLWLGNYPHDLTSEDRRHLRNAIIDARFPAEAQTSLLALLRAKGPDALFRDRALVEQLRASALDGAASSSARLRGATTIARAVIGGHAGPPFVSVLDADELVRCASARLGLSPDLRLRLLDPSDADSATTVRIAPELLIDVVPSGPEVVRTRTRHTRFVLGGAFGLAVLLLAALVGLGVFRARRAEALAELRTDFAAAIAHELRTPLASMRILTELLAEDTLSDEDRRTAATSLLEQTKRLSSSAERMLTLRSLMVGGVSPTKTPVKLAPLLDEAIDDLRTRAPDLAIKRTFAANAVADSDPALLRVIVDNLMDNALKYAGGPSEIAIADVGTAWEIAIMDRGPGVPNGAKARLFEPFERADAKLSDIQGAGLGLAIVRYAADTLDASIGVRDAEPRGAIFFLRVRKCATLASEPPSNHPTESA